MLTSGGKAGIRKRLDDQIKFGLNACITCIYTLVPKAHMRNKRHMHRIKKNITIIQVMPNLVPGVAYYPQIHAVSIWEYLWAQDMILDISTSPILQDECKISLNSNPVALSDVHEP